MQQAKLGTLPTNEECSLSKILTWDNCPRCNQKTSFSEASLSLDTSEGLFNILGNGIQKTVSIKCTTCGLRAPAKIFSMEDEEERERIRALSVTIEQDYTILDLVDEEGKLKS